MTAADVISELRAARPVAGEALRERVGELASREPEPRRAWFGGFTWQRVSTVALPVTAAVALATAGAIGLSRSGTDQRGARADQTVSKEAAAPSSTTPGSATDSSRGGKLSAGTPAIGPVTGRPQRFGAQLTIEVPDSDALSAATQRALQITRSLGGYAVSVSYGSRRGERHLGARRPRADRKGAGCDHPSLQHRHDRRRAGADRRPGRPGAVAGAAGAVAPRADRSPHGAPAERGADG